MVYLGIRGILNCSIGTVNHSGDLIEESNLVMLHLNTCTTIESQTNKCYS